MAAVGNKVSHWLFTRKLYPNEAFVKKKIYSTTAFVCQHPEVNNYMKNVLATIKELIITDSEKVPVIHLNIFDSHMHIIEKYVFNIQLLQVDVCEKDPYSVNLEDSLRTVCLKLSMATCYLNPLPDDATFEIDVLTSKRAYIFLGDRQCDDPNFPWKLAKRESLDNDVTSLLPVASIQNEKIAVRNSGTSGTFERWAVLPAEMTLEFHLCEVHCATSMPGPTAKDVAPCTWNNRPNPATAIAPPAFSIDDPHTLVTTHKKHITKCTMELKVWVEGIQRIVCGVTESTTCQDVVYALAHATAQTGRFTLIERWRTNERFLSPNESPVINSLKWGEYASEVQLILRRSTSESNKTHASLGVHVSQGTRCSDMSERSKQSPTADSVHDNQKASLPTLDVENTQELLEYEHDVQKSFAMNGLAGNTTASDSELQLENVSVVQPTLQLKARVSATRKAAHKSGQASSGAVSNDGNIYLPRKKVRELPPYRDPPGLISQLRTLPPYREPPPPNSNSPSRLQFQGDIKSPGTPRHKDNQSSPRNSTRLKRNLAQDFQETKRSSQLSSSGSGHQSCMVTVAYTQRYVELIRLVNRQRDTINAQQADLTKFDAEILYWESKSREHTHEMDFISQEVNRIESAGRVIEEQLKDFTHAEEESEIVRQQEKTLKSELTLLRSKLANCETELLQCKNKIRMVMDELALEQHVVGRELDDRQIVEHRMMEELEHLQEDIEHAKQSADFTSKSAESLKLEVNTLEAVIIEKKLQVERLVTDMKEANLQSLTVACQDDQVKHLLEGVHKPSSTRKIIGSPRQLETAVPTNRNPHGVWV